MIPLAFFIALADVLVAVGVLLALVGFVTLLFIAWDGIETWWLLRGDEPSYGFTPAKVDRGTQILDYANEDVLRGIANHHGLDGPPAKIEESKRRRLRGGPKVFQGAAEKGTTTTVEPRDDLAEMLRRLLGHLHVNGELDQSADCVLAEVLDDERVPPPFLHDQGHAREYFEGWLAANYPDGLADTSTTELAAALAAVGRTPPEDRIRDAIRENFASLDKGANHLLFLEGEWSIADAENEIVLSRTNLRLAFTPYEVDGSSSIPIPKDVSITAKLDREALTPHGRNRMVGVTKPIRASILATYRQYADETGRLEVVPVAVFQRLD